MFVVDRSALAVLLPIALLLGVVVWSNYSEGRQAATRQTAQAEIQRDQTVAANLPSR
jgi:hypothetical protein